MAENIELAVNCTKVVKTYGADDSKVMALRGVDLEVRKGELMMLVGPSGCGKTTLISVIAGILDHDEGSCMIYERDFQRMAGHEKVRYRAANIGFVFQAYNLLPALTAAENVAVPLIINGVKRRDAVEKASVLLGKIGMKEKLRSLPSQLSGGQQQRVAIARALIHNPRLIVCDEPTSALDHETGQKVMELLKSIALDNNRALIIVTHDSRVFNFADRIAKMDDGHIVQVANSPEELVH